MLLAGELAGYCGAFEGRILRDERGGAGCGGDVLPFGVFEVCGEEGIALAPGLGVGVQFFDAVEAG